MSEAHAFGAVSVLNATATGRGCSLAVQEGLRARWTWLDEPGLVWRQRDVDADLAQAVLKVLRGAFDCPPGADAGTSTQWPPRRGLKTSSSAAGALVQAALAALDKPSEEAALRLAVEANIAAGSTLTGAFDDQVAVLRGGCHLTDNTQRRIVQAIPTKPWHVAIWVPESDIPKAAVRGIDTGAAASKARSAEARLKAGDVPGAMTLNGEAFHALYAAAGLPVDDAPARAAREAGALGAGLSGTGPAVAALFDAPTDLPHVPGGRWQWSRVAEVVA